jgi:hypothetical protein
MRLHNKSSHQFYGALALNALVLVYGCGSPRATENQNQAANRAPASSPTPPQKTEPPSITFGGIEVTSTPPGASVLLILQDESGAAEPQPRGVTPVTIDRLSPGKYTVYLERPGHRPFQKAVEVKANATIQVRAKLRKQ